MNSETKTRATLGSFGKKIHGCILNYFSTPKEEFVQSADFYEEIPFAEHRDLIRAKFSKWPTDPALLVFVRDLESLVSLCTQRTGIHIQRERRGFSDVRLRFKRTKEAETAQQILIANCSIDYMAYIGHHIAQLIPQLGQKTLHLGQRGFRLSSAIENILMDMHYCVQTPSLKKALRNDASSVRTLEDLSYARVGAQISKADNKKFWKLKSFLTRLYAQARADERNSIKNISDEVVYTLLQETTRHMGVFIVSMAEQGLFSKDLLIHHEFMIEFMETVRVSDDFLVSIDFSAYQVTQAASLASYWRDAYSIGNRLYGKLFIMALLQLKTTIAQNKLFDQRAFSHNARLMLEARLGKNQTRYN